MALQIARMLLSEIVNVVSPASFGRNVVVNQGGLALTGIRSAGFDDNQGGDIFGPLWFAVPKKRVRSQPCGYNVKFRSLSAAVAEWCSV